MRIVKWIFFAFLIILVQTQFFFLKDFVNISVAIVYFFGLKSLQNISSYGYSSARPEIEGVIFGVAVGLIEDILSGSIIGPCLLSKGFIGFITPVVFTNFVFKWTPLWGAIIIVLFTFVDGVLVAGSRVIFTGIIINNANIFKMLFIQPLLGIPFAIILKP